MSSLYQPPLIPGLGSYNGPMGSGNLAQTRNPFFSVSNQFLPRNLHDVIRWVRFITLHSPVTTEVVRKLSTYPITKFTYEAKDPAVREKYEQITKSFRLTNALHDIGYQYFTVGNVFLSIYYPFNRTYRCPNTGCRSLFGAANAEFLKFKNYAMQGVCPVCNQSSVFERIDQKSKNIADMNLIIWDPLNISVNHNPISGKSKYFYKIPNDIRKKIMSGDRLTIDSLPWEFIEAVKDQKDFEFSDDHIFHMKNIDMGMAINGVSIPPMVSHFNLVFYQATLRRANESIATDFMAPMRVIFPQAQGANSDPVVSLSMRNFVSKMEEALVKHKHDNNHVLIAPVPIGYQAVSGEGKTLLVNQEIAQAEESLLLSMGVSRELLSGTTNWTSSTVGLRMLKNTLDSYVGQIDEVLDWISTKISTYLGITNSKIRMTPFQLTDDDSLKAILMNLAQGGNISMSTVYESLGRSYEDELERIAEDAKLKARHDVRVQYEVEQAQYLEGLEIKKLNDKDSSYMETLAECQRIAGELIPADPNMTRQVLNELKITDYAKYLMISKLVEEGRTHQTNMMNAEQEQALQGEATTPGGANAPKPGIDAGGESEFGPGPGEGPAGTTLFGQPGSPEGVFNGMNQASGGGGNSGGEPVPKNKHEKKL